MNRSIKTAFVAFVLAACAVAPVSAQQVYNQLAASAGLSQAEAAGLTTAQIAAHFFNRNISTSDRQAIPGARGDVMARGPVSNIELAVSSRNEPSLTLTQITAIQANRHLSTSDRQAVIKPVNGPGSDRRQLAASAGFGLDGAEGRSLTELAAVLGNRHLSTSDQLVSGY